MTDLPKMKAMNTAFGARVVDYNLNTIAQMYGRHNTNLRLARQFAASVRMLAMLKTMKKRNRGACPWCNVYDRHTKNCKLAALLAELEEK